MGKKNYTFSLDEGLMNKAKEEINNISGFFNECLEIYLHTNSDEFELGKISEDIRKLNLKRDLIVKMQLRNMMIGILLKSRTMLGAGFIIHILHQKLMNGRI